jgi:P27 family predicted phage terminase small subunit
MARKPKPTALKELAGNPGKRRLPNEPTYDNRKPTCPTHLSDEGKAEWKRIVNTLHESGVLKWTDRATLAAYCEAYGRWVQAERLVRKSGLLIKTSNDNVIQNPAVGVANKAMADMVRYASEFGMTPASRATLGKDAVKPEDRITLADQLFAIVTSEKDK